MVLDFIFNHWEDVFHRTNCRNKLSVVLTILSRLIHIKRHKIDEDLDGSLSANEMENANVLFAVVHAKLLIRGFVTVTVLFINMVLEFKNKIPGHYYVDLLDATFSIISM